MPIRYYTTAHIFYTFELMEFSNDLLKDSFCIAGLTMDC